MNLSVDFLVWLTGPCWLVLELSGLLHCFYSNILKFAKYRPFTIMSKEFSLQSSPQGSGHPIQGISTSVGAKRSDATQRNATVIRLKGSHHSACFRLLKQIGYYTDLSGISSNIGAGYLRVFHDLVKRHPIVLAMAPRQG